MVAHGLPDEKEMDKLPTFYWLPKMHKDPIKPRFIAASYRCTTKNCSQRLSLYLKAILDQQTAYCQAIDRNMGVNRMWIIKNNEPIRAMIERANLEQNLSSVSTFDFTTLYTSIPHRELKEQLGKVIRDAFRGKPFLTAYNKQARWTFKRSTKFHSVTAETLINELKFLVDNIYVICGNQLYRQVIGIPMGTDCAPFLANLFLYSYETEWLKRLAPIYKGRHYRNTGRFIDDLIVFNAGKKFEEHIQEIYPAALRLERTNKNDTECNFLDLHVSIQDGVGTTKIYNKTDEYPFHVIRYPHALTNAPSSSCYGIAIGQWLRYLRGCMKKEDFIQRARELLTMFEEREYCKRRLQCTWKKFLSRHGACKIYRCSKRDLTRDVFQMAV